MSYFTAALVQADLAWAKPEQNQRIIAQCLADNAEALDLIVLPEMFNSGYTLDTDSAAQTMDGPSIGWLRDMAQQHQAAVCGSLAIVDNGRFFNRLLFVRPDGSLNYYDKRHLFRMAGEHERYSSGARKLVVEWRGWRICPMVCYDLRFPVWSRNTGDYDMLLYVANWPQARRLHWRQLLIARAIENQSAVIGVNRVGTDGNGLQYSGDSLAIDAQGELLLDPLNQCGLHICQFDRRLQDDYRQRFPAHQDADHFSIEG